MKKQNSIFLTFFLITSVFIISALPVFFAQAQTPDKAQELTELQEKIDELDLQIKELRIEILKLIEKKIKQIEKEIIEIELKVSQLNKKGTIVSEIVPQVLSATDKKESKPERPTVVLPPIPRAAPTPIPIPTPPSPPQPQPEPKPEPEPEPVPPPEGGEPIVCSPPLASGEQPYSVSSQGNPRITWVVVDPMDVNKYARQQVSVKIRDTAGNPITQVAGQAKTNTMSFPFTLELDTKGTWQGEWYNEDEYCNNYMVIITAQSASGSSKVELTFR